MLFGNKFLKFDNYLACDFNLYPFLEVNFVQLTVVWGHALCLLFGVDMSLNLGGFNLSTLCQFRRVLNWRFHCKTEYYTGIFPMGEM